MRCDLQKGGLLCESAGHYLSWLHREIDTEVYNNISLRICFGLDFRMDI